MSVDEATQIDDAASSLDDPFGEGDDREPSRWPSPLAIAACASIGAGGIHASVIGAHGDHRLLATMFVWVAAFQVCWGIAMLLRPSRELAALGLVGNATIASAWLITRLRGISVIDGLEARESIQFADAAAATLAIVVVGITLGALLTPGAAGEHRVTNLAVPAFLVATLALPAMVTGGTHVHSGADTTPGHEHGAAVAPRPYDPTQPIDLSGVDGVTAQQQARAENLVAITLARLPKFADPATAESLGWRSIGDAFTGYEHFINWDLIDDDQILDPDFPESLVYRVEDGRRTLVSAMFMLPRDRTLDAVPELGGTLTQWHIHDNLCFTPDPVAPKVAGVTSSGGSCRAPLVKGPAVPMIHVWIVPHPCGPFAALEGVGAGQIQEGEARWCDHAHGATGTFS